MWVDQHEVTRVVPLPYRDDLTVDNVLSNSCANLENCAGLRAELHCGLPVRPLHRGAFVEHAWVCLIVVGLSDVWSTTLDLTGRISPEFYTAESDLYPSNHSDIMALSFGELGVNAIFCVEGVPTVAIVERLGQFDIDRLHRVLWNQGIFSVLLVLDERAATAYSLAELPVEPTSIGSGIDTRVIEVLEQTSNALELRELFRSIESGRYWTKHEGQFRSDSRVDQVLLANLQTAFSELSPQLGTAASQALLMQTMFVAYVEDRGMVTDSPFVHATEGKAQTFLELLDLGRPKDLDRLFENLKGLFNGGLFLEPTALSESQGVVQLSRQAMTILARFRRGEEAMAMGQYRFWAYDFRYIPIALISAVYDRFLGNESALRKKHGAFYTPAFLVDVVVEQLWENLTPTQRESGSFMDPACGSGIFLVRLFQRLVASRRTGQVQLTWDELVGIAERLHGADIDRSAVRITAFSLYIALLEQMDPREIVELTRRGHLLPTLLGHTLLFDRDFIASKPIVVDAILGNPPWKGRPGEEIQGQRPEEGGDLAEDHEEGPAPAKDIAWQFVWKALQCVRPDGLIGLLLPAMGILHNPSSAKARSQLFARAHVRRVINFSDLVFELFDGANRPTCLVLYAPRPAGVSNYTFDYWVPKSDPSLRLKRFILLPNADRLRLRSANVFQDETLFKRRLWTRSSDERLFGYLKTFPQLSNFLRQFKDLQSSDLLADGRPDWVIGQGFKFAKAIDKRKPGYVVHDEPRIARYPFFSAKEFTPLAINYDRAAAPYTSEVHRIGFIGSFEAPHILIPQGVVRDDGRLRAAFGSRSVSFNSSLQAITVPKAEEEKAKLLTAVLNSKLAAWFFFHSSAYMGADRAKVIQSQLLQLPFDAPDQMPDTIAASDAAQRLVEIVDGELAQATKGRKSIPKVVWDRLDGEVFRYYGFDEADKAIVNDAFDYIIPAMQPRLKLVRPKLWGKTTFADRERYALKLCEALSDWVRGGVGARLVGSSADFMLLRLTFSDESDPSYTEIDDQRLGDAISRAGGALVTEARQNLQLVPDLKVAMGHYLYLLKPNRLRDWLLSGAEADAGDIAADLHRSTVIEQ